MVLPVGCMATDARPDLVRPFVAFLYRFVKELLLFMAWHNKIG